MSTFAHIAFQNFIFVIHCTPKVVPFAVNLDKNLTQIPLSRRVTARMVTPFSRNLWCTHWPEVVSPKPDCFIAYGNASLVKKVLHITKWKRKSYIKYPRQVNDLRADFEVAKWRIFCHLRKLKISPTRFKQVLPDRTTVWAHKLASLNVIWCANFHRGQRSHPLLQKAGQMAVTYNYQSHSN